MATLSIKCSSFSWLVGYLILKPSRMASTSPREDVSARHGSDAEEDIFALLDNLPPFDDEFLELDLLLQQQNESASVNQEVLQGNVSHPPVETQSQLPESSRVSRRRLSTRNPLSMETMSSLYHLPIDQASKAVGWGECSFKKRCRELGIKRWPHRKLQSLNFVVNKLQELRNSSTRVDKEELNEAILVVENQRQALLSDPNLDLEPITIKYRKVAHRALDRERKKNKNAEASSNNEQGD